MSADLSAGDPEALAALLAGAGFIAAQEEAAELLAAGGDDAGRLRALVDRRLSGEPLAWITGGTDFFGSRVIVEPGVYVPRWQSELLVARALERLAEDGIAVDVCTGSGALAKVLALGRPRAEVLATELDARAAACARRNGVDVRLGDLFEPLPDRLRGRVDLVVGVVPYVPTPALGLLPRDTFLHESTLSYLGGPDGTDVLRRVLEEAPALLRRGGALLLETGAGQADALSADLSRLGYTEIDVLRDEEGDERGLEASFAGL